MAKKDQDFEIYQGDDREVKIELTDQDGAVLDISGASATWEATLAVGGDAVISKTPTLTTEDSKSYAVITLVPGDTTDLRPFGYYHECEVVDAASKTFTAAVGTMTVNKAQIK